MMFFSLFVRRFPLSSSTISSRKRPLVSGIIVKQNMKVNVHETARRKKQPYMPSRATKLENIFTMTNEVNQRVNKPIVAAILNTSRLNISAVTIIGTPLNPREYTIMKVEKVTTGTQSKTDKSYPNSWK